VRATLSERGREIVADTDGEDRLRARCEEVRERDRDIVERDKDPPPDADRVVGEKVSEVNEKKPDAVIVGDSETDAKVPADALSEDVKRESSEAVSEEMRERDGAGELDRSAERLIDADFDDAEDVKLRLARMVPNPILTNPSAVRGTSQPETPSKKPPENEPPPLVRPAGHWLNSVIRPLLVMILTTPSALYGTSQIETPSKKPPANASAPLVRPAGQWLNNVMLPFTVEILTTPSAVTGTSHPETPSKKPPANAAPPLLRPAGHWLNSVMLPLLVKILTTPLALYGTSQPETPS
jgi:hypothetical protein